jgi:hypothetical protein
METSNINRSSCIEELAKSISPRGSIANIPGTFLQDLKTYLNLSDSDIGLIFSVSRTNILRKRNAAAENKEKLKAEFPATKETAQAPATVADQSDDVPAEFSDMPTEDKIQYITRKYDRCIDGKEVLSKDQIAALKNRLEDLRTLQASQIEEGSRLISQILNVLLKDYVRNFKASYEAAFLRLKVDMVNALVDTTWHALDRILEGREDSDKLKDEVINKLQSMVAGLGNEFDPIAVFRETGMNHPVLKQEVDKYLATQRTTPGLVGGGIIRDSTRTSVVGGAQYRQQAKEAQREEAARKGGI